MISGISGNNPLRVRVRAHHRGSTLLPRNARVASRFFLKCRAEILPFSLDAEMPECHARKAAHSVAGGRMPNAEAMMKSECRIGAISGWLHSVDSVRFSAFCASSAVQKAKAAQQRVIPLDRRVQPTAAAQKSCVCVMLPMTPRGQSGSRSAPTSSAC